MQITSRIYGRLWFHERLFCVLLCVFPGHEIQAQTRFSFRRGLMGTQFNLIFYTSDSTIAQRANTAVSARMDSLNLIMSDYLDGSEINRLSATAGSDRWVPVSTDLFRVLQKAQFIARRSSGRFDPTIGPLSLLWRRAVRRNVFPSHKERRRARRAVGYQLMEIDSSTQTVRLLRPGMRLDVGGIGQGFAIDEALKVLHQFDIQSALVDIGGDVLTGEAPPKTAGWHVGLSTGKSTLDATSLLLRHAAVTTSGDAYRFLEHNGHRYSHIMNPRSGLGLRHFVQVSVLAPDGYRADALTKVFSVCGIKKSCRLLKRFPGVEVLILENKRGHLRQWKSKGFPPLVKLAISLHCHNHCVAMQRGC